MIRVSPDDIRFAQRLGKLCRSPSPVDGLRSWVRTQGLGFDGDNWLTFQASDYEVGVVSRFQVEGEDSSWERRVVRADLDCFALGASGGRYSLNADPAHCLRFEKNHPEVGLGYLCEFRYPLFRKATDAPFPGFHEPPDVAWNVASVSELRTAIHFLAPKHRDADPQSRMSSCALLADRTAVSYVEGVFLRTSGPELSGRIDIYRPNAVCFQRWLGLMQEKEQDQVRVAVAISPQGRTYLLAATLDSNHLFQVIATPRILPAAAVDCLDGDGLVLEAIVPRQPMMEMTGVLTQFPGCKLLCRWKRSEDESWSLVVAVQDLAVPACGEVPAAVVRMDPDPRLTAPFTFAAEQGRVALERFRGDRIRLRYRPSARILILSEEDETGIPPAACPKRAYLRIEVDAV